VEVNIHHAKTNLSRLILQAESGEEVIIARAGKPAVRLVPVETPKKKRFKPGALKGRLFVPDNFLDPDLELEALFNDGPVFPGENPPSAIRIRSKVPQASKRTNVSTSQSRGSGSPVSRRTSKR
jgi:prevent-host-death family protein